MQRRGSLRYLNIVLVLAAVLGVHAGFAVDLQPLQQKLDQASKDIHASQKLLSGETNPEARMAALSKESSSLDELKRMVSKVDSEEEAKQTLDAFRQFGYRLSTAPEKKAFLHGINSLESRLKFLTQSENPAYSQYLNQINGIVAEVDSKPISLERAGGSRVRKMVTAAAATSRSEADGLLGAKVANGKTSFSVYSPEATEVSVVIFQKPEDKTGKGYPMKKNADGIWECSIEGELYGKFYGYSADGPKGDGYLFDPRRLLSDPYALANYNHDGKTVITKTDFTWTDQGFKTPAAKDLVLYEMHVKDYTAHSSSGVDGAAKGKYLGLLQGKGTDKVLGNLVDLGVNAVELLPCHEFDNNFAGHMNHWGYMTSHFFAPEGNFASGKCGEQIKEFKQMVNGLHKAGIAVIMDVVFNHTAEGNEQGLPLNFKGLDNGGYYRLMDNKKFYWNGTGCGNEFRSDNPMTRKYILDSLKYWVKEYHIDGFRFDLGTIIDKETMNEMFKQLPASTILVSEPWAADWKRNQWGKGDFRNTKLGKWNDDFRENIRAFCKGMGDRNNVMTVLAGSCFWWAAKPSESVNYVECHDGGTLNDIFNGDKNRIKLAAAALLTAQGIPMIHEGQEFMKSKMGNDNSYDQDNNINWIDWGVKKANKDIFDFYKGLIALRMKYENFRHATALNNQHINWIQPANGRAVGFHLKGKPDFFVLLNSDSNEWVKFQLPDGNEWTVVCNGDKVADDGSLGTCKGDYNVPAQKAIILKSK